MSSAVTRHFATLQGRQVHYRRAGNGAAVLLLHQTPASSIELLPLMLFLASRFTVIAPDMPGYGASDPLHPIGSTAARGQASANALTIDALADDLASFMSILGIDAAGIYGFHTGASIATAFARRHPARVAVTIAEGLLCLDLLERKEWLVRYLEPFIPRWDGSHLSWMWARLKDQSVFFPWYDRSARGRLAIDAASPAVLAAKALDWLRSGERYYAAYQAAMNYDPRADITHLTTAHYVVAQQGDPLVGHLERLPRVAPNVRVEVWTGTLAGIARIDEIFRAHCATLTAPPLAMTAPIESGIWREYVGSAGAQLCITRAGNPKAPALVLQHDAQSCSKTCEALLAGCAVNRAVYAMDMPGHGLSDVLLTETDCTIEHIAEQIRNALAVFGLDDVDYLGIGAGAAVVVELQTAMQRSRRRSLAAHHNSGSLTLIAPIDLSDNGSFGRALADSYVHAPLDSYGGYLLCAWHAVRDHQLFFPWFERRRAYGAAVSAMPSPQWLQDQTVAHILSGASGVALRRQEALYPLRARVHAFAGAVRFAASHDSPRLPHASALVSPNETWVPLSDSMSEWSRLLYPSGGQQSVR